MIRVAHQRARGDRAVGVLALAVAVAVGSAAVPVARRLMAPDDGRRTATVATPRPVPPPDLAPLDLAPLRRFAPFGAQPGVPGDPTAAGLALRGILLARPAAASIALIAAAGGPAKGYGVGATLPGGAILDAVEFDLVVLRVNGALVTLALPARPGGTFAAAGPAPPPPPAAVAADPIAAHQRAEVAMPDPSTLLGSLAATVGPGGARIGVNLPDALRRAGLAPGDTIEKVDGVAIGDAARNRALFDDAVVAGRMRVEVIRAGRPVTVTVPLH